MEQDKALRESASEKERFADQQFGATAARDQELAEDDTLDSEKPSETGIKGNEPRGGKPRAGNKAD